MFGECENSAKEIPAKEAWNEAKICTYSSGGCGCRSGGIGYGPDEDVWEKVKSGEYPMFSIEGEAERVEVEEE